MDVGMLLMRREVADLGTPMISTLTVSTLRMRSSALLRLKSAHRERTPSLRLADRMR
jgi:hypothetical protein